MFNILYILGSKLPFIITVFNTNMSWIQCEKWFGHDCNLWVILCLKHMLILKSFSVTRCSCAATTWECTLTECTTNTSPGNVSFVKRALQLRATWSSTCQGAFKIFAWNQLSSFTNQKISLRIILINVKAMVWERSTNAKTVEGSSQTGILRSYTGDAYKS